MDQSRWGRPSAAGRRSGATGGRLALAAAAAAAVSLLAGCQSAGGPTAGTASPTGSSEAGSTASGTAPASTASASTAATASASPSAKVAFVPITEPFDPGHPARAVSSPATCVGQTTTLAIERCFENKTETADSTGLSDVSWYTTPAGTRIGMTDTQGDETGGIIVSWIIIAGTEGFVINPAQFSYVDGKFTDPGVVGLPSPRRHKVTPGTEYQFGIDYSRLRSDPGNGDAGGYVYAPGTPVAVWK